ncbi:NAD-dependent epimerase/dehydratase family protein [Hymenobacter ruber]
MADILTTSTLMGSVAVTCVIGGAGFIGRAVVDELLQQGRRVVVVGREATPAPALPAGVEYVANPTGNDDELLRRVLSKVNEVIDLAYATVPKTSFQDPVHDILVNLPTAVRLFELAASLPIRKFVWISSGGTVYGRTKAPFLTEEHLTEPISPYGITKLAIEKYAHMYFESQGLPVVCVRPSNAFGEGQRTYSGQGFIATAIASILDGRELSLYGEEGTVRDYLYVQDVARGIVASLINGQPGQVYNLGSGHGLTNRQVLDALAPLAASTGHAIKLRVLPVRPFDVPLNVLNSEKLTAHTQWHPQLDFAEGLARTWAWYAAHYQTAAARTTV